VSANPYHSSDNGSPADDAWRVLERACDAALLGDMPTDEECRAARELGIDLADEVETFERVAAQLDAEHYASQSRRAPSARSQRPRASTAAEEMPPELRARLLALADAMQSPTPIPIARGRGPGVAAIAVPSSNRSRVGGRLGGWLVAAACITLGAVTTWTFLSAGSTQRDEIPTDPKQFVSMHPTSVRWPWKPAKDAHVVGELRGEAIFDPRTSQGLLTIEGLAVNDPDHEQYQLWIFDAERDERYPVDGGVFDVPACGKAVIPIRAKLGVAKPTLLAVTVEKPGGAVVSDRRIAILAQP
jgi:hypothetical protein